MLKGFKTVFLLWLFLRTEVEIKNIACKYQVESYGSSQLITSKVNEKLAHISMFLSIGSVTDWSNTELSTLTKHGIVNSLLQLAIK